MNFSGLRKYKFLILIAFVFASQFSNAQLTTSTTFTPTMLVQGVLLGTGVTASGITYTGYPLARGTFNGTLSNIGLNSGVILSSGDIANSIGPNNVSGVSSANSLIGDPDLDIVMFPTLSFDATILEFDFVPTSDTVKFRYVFGSDEYMEFVSTVPGGINDGFGFFISGPGISGPFSGGAENIALIPGTSLPVTMFNLNLVTNSAYYFDNGDGLGSGTAPDGATVQYDGFTVPLTATAAVQCGQTYHIKLAIGDGGDDIIDSGVFLEAGSFSSTGSVVMTSTTNFGGNVTGDDTTIYEGCGFASILFDRGTSNLAAADTFYYTLSGTAVNGVDYSTVGDSVYFPVGQDTAVVTINSLPDALIEGTETVTLTCLALTPCGGNDTASLTLRIIDTPPLTMHLNNDTTLFCPFHNLPLTAATSGGVAIGNYTYLWTNTSSVTDTAQVNPAVTTTYYVTVSDSCGNTANDSITINVLPYTPMSVSLTSDTSICEGNGVLLDANVVNGFPDYLYIWSPDISLIDSATVHPDFSTTYTLMVLDHCGQFVSDTVNVNVFPVHADFGCDFITNQSAQFVNQSTGAVSYLWNFGDGSADSASTLENPAHNYQSTGYYVITLIVINQEGCTDTIQKPINVIPDFYFYFPNAFSPNANGVNETYKGVGTGIKKYHMQIFDRWGERIFESSDINTGWDGTYKGAKATSSVYVVVFDIEGYHDEVKKYRGSITLVH